MKNKESDIQRHILAYLHSQNVFCRKIHTTGIYDPVKKRFRRNYSKGMADIIGIIPCKPYGIPLAVEVKTSKRKLTKEQIIFALEFTNAGGIYLLCHSLDELIEDYEATKRENLPKALEGGE